MESSRTILKQFTATEFNSDNEGIVYPIYQPTETIDGRAYTGFLTDLRLRSEAPSLMEVPLPTFPIGTSTTAKAEGVRAYEWDSDRFEIELCLQLDTGNWHPLYTIAVKNHPPYHVKDVLSYLTNNPAFTLNNKTQLGVRFVDAGFGYPGANDKFLFYGVVREEINKVEEVPITSANHFKVNISAGGNVGLLLANSARKGAILQNVGNTEVDILFASAGNMAFAIKLYPQNQFEITSTNLYTGQVRGSCQNSDNELRIVEFT